MKLAILFHFLCAQHVSDINISIIRSLRLFRWITTLVVLLLVPCVLEFRCGLVGVVSMLQAEASACNTDTTPNKPHLNSNTHRTKNNTTNVVIQQNSRKLLMIDILMSETCWAHRKWNKIASDIKLGFHSSTIKMMQGPINIRYFLFVRVVPKFMNCFSPSTDFSCMLVSAHVQHLIFGEKNRILENGGEIFNP